MADFAAMNAVWEAWVPPGQTPARATVEAKLANPDYRVEIQVVAARLSVRTARIRHAAAEHAAAKASRSPRRRAATSRRVPSPTPRRCP